VIEVSTVVKISFVVFIFVIGLLVQVYHNGWMDGFQSRVKSSRAQYELFGKKKGERL